MMHLGEEEENPTLVGVEARTMRMAAEPLVWLPQVINGGLR
jgi:hypothetical protein